MEWVQIENSKYDINREGQVRSRKYGKERILKPWIRGDGYIRVDIYYNGSKKGKLVHRLLALAFIDNPEQKPCVDHIDRNTSNNSLSNLRWATHSENCRNRTRKGSVYTTKYNTWTAEVRDVNGKRMAKSFKTYVEADKWRIDNLVQPII